MNKKQILLLIVITMLLIVVGTFLILNGNKKNDNNQVQNKNTAANNKEDSSNKLNKILILYFSATGNTKKIAEYIKEETNGDLVEIVPEEKYTSSELDYNSDCRANKEQNDSSARPKIKNSINVDDYNTIFIGYPIWWGDVPKIILTLLDTYNFEGKTVIPFCTSGSTSISQSESTLKSYNNKVNWKNGERFSATSSKEEVKKLINEL